MSLTWLGGKISLKYLLIGGGMFVLLCPKSVDITDVQTSKGMIFQALDYSEIYHFHI